MAGFPNERLIFNNFHFSFVFQGTSSAKKKQFKNMSTACKQGLVRHILSCYFLTLIPIGFIYLQ